MGVEYLVVCDDCEVMRNLGKFCIYACGQMVTTLEDALEFRDDIREDAFEAGLIVSFMCQHIGHRCRVLSEHDAKREELYDRYKQEILWPGGQVNLELKGHSDD